MAQARGLDPPHGRDSPDVLRTAGSSNGIVALVAAAIDALYVTATVVGDGRIALTGVAPPTVVAYFGTPSSTTGWSNVYVTVVVALRPLSALIGVTRRTSAERTRRLRTLREIALGIGFLVKRVQWSGFRVQWRRGQGVIL